MDMPFSSRRSNHLSVYYRVTQSVNHHMSAMNPSEAPEDQLLLTSLPAQALPFPGKIEADATDRKRYVWLELCSAISNAELVDCQCETPDFSSWSI
jgi:hypothetical protein